MKITINQAEIHGAIDAYIRSQISVNDGMKIEVQIRATRGDEGMTAEIDIVPDVPEPVVEAEAPKAVVRKPRAPKLDIATKVEEAKADPAAAKAIDEAPTKAAVEQTQDVAEELPEDPEPNSEAALAAEAAATEPVDPEAGSEAEAEKLVEQAAAEPAPRQSLFGGLKKPVNE